MTDFKLEITLRGAEYTKEMPDGDRTERDTLARIEVPVEALKGWAILQGALRDAISPPVVEWKVKR